MRVRPLSDICNGGTRGSAGLLALLLPETGVAGSDDEVEEIEADDEGFEGTLTNAT